MNRFIYVRILLLLTFFQVNSSFAQDTLKIYFESGKSTVRPHYDKLISHFFNHLDPDEIDFVSIIGYSDSLGRIKGNLRLSQKRAESVQKVCSKHVKDSTSFDLNAQGEKAQLADSLSRRVEIIVYAIKHLDEGDIDLSSLDTIGADDPRCIYIDYHALRYCNVRFITKNKKEYAYIQAIDNYEFKNTKHYYIKSGGTKNAVAQRINWKTKSTGKLWWKKKRLVATIPKASFDQFQLVIIEETPCSGCKDDILKKDTNVLTYKVLQPDYFLSECVQLKSRVFKRKYDQLRIPREFVDLTKPCYIDLVDRNYSINRIHWEEKKAKRKSDYYYAEVLTGESTQFYLAQESYSSYCPYTDTLDRNYDYYAYWRPWGRCLRTRSRSGFWANVYLSTEAGAFYHNDSVTGFLTLGAQYMKGRSTFGIMPGFNSRLGLYSTVRYQFSFAEFSILKLGGFSAWTTPDKKPIVASLESYLGTEVRLSYNKTYLSFVEMNAHLGLRYWSYMKTHELAFYFHGGVAKDVTNRINNNFYPYLQLGCQFFF